MYVYLQCNNKYYSFIRVMCIRQDYGSSVRIKTTETLNTTSIYIYKYIYQHVLSVNCFPPVKSKKKKK